MEVRYICPTAYDSSVYLVNRKVLIDAGMSSDLITKQLEKYIKLTDLELNLACTRRLSAMIGNLLDVSRMEAGVMEYELKSTDLASLVRNVVAEFAPQANEQSLAFSIEAPEHPVMVECDGDRIMQVIRNLMSNAVKFSPQCKEIRVRVTSEALDSAGAPASRPSSFLAQNQGKLLALVSVADSGPGVPDEH